MLRFLCFFMFLSFSYVFSQKNIIIVEYKLDVVSDERLENLIKNAKVQHLKNRYISELEEEDKFYFILEISDTISKFYLSKYTFDLNATPDDLIGRHPLLSEYSGISFYNDNKYFIFYDFFNSFTYQPIDSNWILTQESKIIDGKTVFKATSSRTIINPVGTFVFPVVAWYCPEIPHKYGPIGFGNLPGLILHLRYKNAEYQVTKIDFKPKGKMDVDLFNKYPKESIDKPFDEELFKPNKD